MGSDRPGRPGCWSRSATSPASRTEPTSRPGPAPHRSTHPPGTTSATGSPAPATGRSTGSCTSWPPSSCATPGSAATTTTAREPPGRPRWKRCAASNADSPTSCSGPCSTTPPPTPPARRRAREGTGERLSHPARPAHIPTPTLRISHFPDPSQTSLERSCPPRLDTEGSHDRASRLAARERFTVRVGARGQSSTDLECLSDHPMPLCLERLVADEVGPDGGADRFPQKGALPGRGLARITAVAGPERLFQVRSTLPLLAGQPGQVGRRRPPIGSAEVDDADPALVDQPVAWLPVTMGRHELRRFVVVPGDRVPEPGLGDGVDAVITVQPRDRAGIHAGLVVLRHRALLGVKGRKELTGLAIGIGVLRSGVVLHEGARQVAGGQNVLVPVRLQQPRAAAGIPPGRRPLLMRSDLPPDVMVPRAGSLDDRLALGIPHVQDDGVDQPPAEVGHDLHVGEPTTHHVFLRG